MRKDWKCESWEEVVDDEEIQGPTDTDNYNDQHGIKPDLENRFDTVLQCLFEYTAIKQYFSNTCW